MNRSIGNGDTSGARSIGDQATMQGGFSEIQIGTKTGPDSRYQIKDVLGKGGMGEVYLALDEVSKTEVAIKTVPREVATNAEEMEQVQKNFALVRNLHHPNIAAVTALERLPSGEIILIMEFVGGRRTLQKERLSGGHGRLPVPEAVQICKQIAEALDYAHSQKIIHRDVKPSNVLLTPEGQVKLTDFGLAAQIMSSMKRVSMLPTQTSGTRPYMAPEQWEGRLQDAQTDQWSLAVLFYELVSGRLPFPADDIDILERQILERTPEMPESLTSNQWTSLQRALNKEKEQRFPECTAFIKAIEADQQQTHSNTERAKLYILIIGALLLISLSGYLAFPHFNRNTQPIQTISSKEQTQRDKQAVDSAEVSTPLEEMLSRASKGNADAQFLLGLNFFEGIQAPQSYKKALHWFNLAASQNDSLAQNYLGIMYSQGFGVSIDNAEGFRWFSLAAKQGLAAAEMNVGGCYEFGRGIEKDFSTALYWYQRAADQGDAMSALKTGHMYYQGRGTEQDFQLASFWFHAAAEQGVHQAEALLGLMYLRGEFHEKDYNKAVEWLKKGVEKGDMSAEYYLGICYGHGWGVTRDEDEFLRLMSSAAEKGHSGAEKELKAVRLRMNEFILKQVHEK